MEVAVAEGCDAKSGSLGHGDLYVVVDHHDICGRGGRPGRRIWPRSHGGLGPPVGKNLMISMGVLPVGRDCDSHAQEGQRTHIHGLPSQESSSVPAQRASPAAHAQTPIVIMRLVPQ